MKPGDKVNAKLRRGEILRQGDDRLVDRYRYTVLTVEGDTITVDDGDPSTRWPIEHFTRGESE